MRGRPIAKLSGMDWLDEVKWGADGLVPAILAPRLQLLLMACAGQVAPLLLIEADT